MTRKPGTTEILALIPARGGSKSIPRKNLLSVGGAPLISYSIRQALASITITRTIVTTDDAEIADVARDLGAEVPFLRPPELARDESTDLEVFRHALEWLGKNEGYVPELVVHLRPTCPTRRVSEIDSAIRKMMSMPEADSLRAVSRPAQTPFKMWLQGSDGFLRPVIRDPSAKESYNLPRQSLPEVFWQNGYIDIVRPAIVLEKNEMCGDRILPWLIEHPIFDIDYPEDLSRIEEVMQSLNNGGPELARPRRDPV